MSAIAYLRHPRVYFKCISDSAFVARYLRNHTKAAAMGTFLALIRNMSIVEHAFFAAKVK